MRKIRAFCIVHPLLSGIVSLVFVYVVFQGLGILMEDWPGYSGEIVSRLLCLALIVLIVCGLAGPRIFWPRRRMLALSFCKCCLILLFSFGIALFLGLAIVLLSILARVEPSYALVLKRSLGVLRTDWVLRLLAVVLLCLVVGLFEESLFRGLFLSALLARLGASRRGIVISVLVSAAVFGFAHVLPDLWTGQLATVLALLQALGKVVTTGMIGFMFGALYLKTRNIWGTALVHALNDFFGLWFFALFGSSSLDLQYVQAGGNAAVMLVGYLVMALIYLPLVFMGWHLIRDLRLPQKGFFGKPTWADTAAPGLVKAQAPRPTLPPAGPPITLQSGERTASR
ncbi:MAG: CPBP family intramembrane metalloprotease [Coriobacteriales bacterium]|jgi:membrane protease YdiL (CAAX protease family)|nr:CPBP family intramembrane metalloprotease [Coriobacteriales bacterium]